VLRHLHYPMLHYMLLLLTYTYQRVAMYKCVEHSKFQLSTGRSALVNFMGQNSFELMYPKRLVKQHYAIHSSSSS
jgi:hypothetical protein